jgi:putative hemolysin
MYEPMALINPKDILKANPALNYLGDEYFARFLMYILRFRRLNKLYAGIEDKSGLEFVDEVIKLLELKIGYEETELKRIPSEGPAIVVANHPLGGLDGLLLIKMISGFRTDIKILGNQLLGKIEPVSAFFVDTNPFEVETDSEESAFSGLKESMTHLRNGGILCIFPAGESNPTNISNLVTDRIWRYPIIRFIKRMEVPVIPVHFQTDSSRLFKIMSQIHPRLKEARLPAELFHRRNKSIAVRIGNQIKKADQDQFTDIYQYGRYLRAKTYGMSTPIEVKRFFNYSLRASVKPLQIVDPVSREEILKEIQELRHDHLLFKLEDYSVFAAPSREIPHILNEIGRLREITFREVGEGTNQSIDIDEFDLYYHQLFIWDDRAERIVGAYRIGLGREIVEQYGKRGFYINTLFRIDDTIEGILSQSMELGRSFVVKDYQKKPMPLFLLWKGILYFMLKSTDYRYLIGPVSISNNYSRISKDLIIRFILENHFDWRLSQRIKPRNSYKFHSDDPNINILMESAGRDINKLDKTIRDVDALNSGLPVLLKKYIKLNAKIVCFNVDPKFNNCLDGLIMLDIFDIPRATVESLHKEVNDGSILERFYSNRE